MDLRIAMSRPAFRYEEPERFGESLTTARPWNRSALTDVERLNGRVAMLGSGLPWCLKRSQAWELLVSLAQPCAGTCSLVDR